MAQRELVTELVQDACLFNYGLDVYADQCNIRRNRKEPVNKEDSVIILWLYQSQIWLKKSMKELNDAIKSMDCAL